MRREALALIVALVLLVVGYAIIDRFTYELFKMVTR